MKAVMLSIRPEWCDKIVKGQKTIEIRKTKPKLETPFKCYIYCTKAKSYFANYGLYGDELFKLPNGKVKFGCSMELACYDSSPNKYNEENFLNGKVIGEFVCDYIAQFESEFYDNDSVLNAVWSPKIEENVLYKIWGNDDVDLPKFAKQIAMTLDELKSYIGTDKPCKEFYGWHISDLVVYDKPRKLYKFTKPGAEKIEELEESLCGYCMETDYGKAALYGTPNGPIMCEGRFCNSAYEAYLDDEGFTIHKAPQSWGYVEEVSDNA